MEPYEPFGINVRWTVTTSGTEAFCIAHRLPHPPHAFPLLIDGSYRIVESARAYMWARYVCRVRPPKHATTRFSPNTHRACADDLSQFFDALDELECPVHEIDEAVLNTFAASHDGISPATGRPYKLTTCIRRMGTVVDFVEWMQDHGWLRHRIDFSHVSYGSRYVQPTGHDNNETVNRHRREAHSQKANLTFHVIHEQEAREILKALGHEIKASDPSKAWHASYLGTLIALTTGMRLDELRMLDIDDIEQHRKNLNPAQPLYPYHVKVIGKGARDRYVEFPGWLVKKLLIYIDTDRKIAVEAGKRLYGDRYVEQRGLLLNGGTSTRNRGMRVSSDTIYSGFHRVVTSLAARSILSRVYRFHDCRHTFATWTGLKYAAAGKTNPSLPVKNLLGHRDVATTMNTYQNTMHLYEKSISDDLQKKLAVLVGVYKEAVSEF